jgi:hypothetical protein
LNSKVGPKSTTILKAIQGIGEEGAIRMLFHERDEMGSYFFTSHNERRILHSYIKSVLTSVSQGDPLGNHSYFSFTFLFQEIGLFACLNLLLGHLEEDMRMILDELGQLGPAIVFFAVRRWMFVHVPGEIQGPDVFFLPLGAYVFFTNDLLKQQEFGITVLILFFLDEYINDRNLAHGAIDL